MDQSEFQQLQWGKAPVKPRLTVANIFRDGRGPVLVCWTDRLVACLGGDFGALLPLLRTALEDRALGAELTGYADYAQRVSYRLLPGIW